MVALLYSLRRLEVGPLIVLVWPAILLGTFFAVPLGLIIRVSFAPHDETGLWLPGASFAPYADLFSQQLVRAFLYSIILAVVVATTSLSIALPFTYFVTRMRHRAQTIWLVFLMATLSLSEVLVAFAWQVMLSKRIGISDLLVMLGIMRFPDSLSPGNAAVVTCLVYLIIPFTVMILFPGLSRIDPELLDASRMLGASPRQTFFNIVVPILRKPLITAFLGAAVMTLGSYVTPVVLGKPQFSTVAILISQTALSSEDLPGAAAISIALLFATVLLIGLTLRLGNRRST
jgi:putative spermidine/putrescine transport system permease protein